MEMISAEELVKVLSRTQSKTQLYISSEWLLKLSTFSDPGPVRATLFVGAVDALYSGHLPPSLISRTWFQSWEKFISQPCSEPPGPIDNTVLLYKAPDGTDRLKPRSNFMRIERELYLFLRTIYGGGPEVFLTDQPQWSETELRDVLSSIESKLWAANAKLRKQVTSSL
ncbi:hypothetical protein OESDEN_05004 [Oesophagostomum dentatum]|uniref:DUSP domain-containing protein n=1 Tax=Oesophagostomum dentatum TaxID=61180 RepID=A0A0B1TBY0_OESDE|nr:hypothetical protein OESDEN_05004 [Oesophagostomum dentatum]